MDFFEIQSSNDKPHIYKIFLDGEEGLSIFGKSPDHYTPMKIINRFLNKDVLRLAGSGLMISLFLPEKHMQLWSDEIGTKSELWSQKPYGIHLNKLI